MTYIKHSIRNSSLGGLRLSTLPLGHRSSPQCCIFTSERGRNICVFETWMPERVRARDLRLFKQAALNTAPGPPPNSTSKLRPDNKCTRLRQVKYLQNGKVHVLRPRKMKLNESGFRPPLRTYRLNWARRTSWGWWDDWDDTVLQTQDAKFEPWRSEAEHATSRSRRLPTILTFTRGWGRNITCFLHRRLGAKWSYLTLVRYDHLALRRRHVLRPRHHWHSFATTPRENVQAVSTSWPDVRSMLGRRRR